MTLGAGYSFELLGKSLRAGFSFPFRVALQDEVNSNPSRRFSPFDSSLSLSAGSLFKDEDITGINVSGRFSWALPTSYESINTRKKWGGLSTGLTFSRTWGGFNVSLSSSYFKSFHSSKVPLAPTEIYRASDLATVDGDVAFIERGFANTSYGFSQGLSLGYSFLDNFSVGYNVGIANYFKYDIVPEDDVYTPEGLRPRHRCWAVRCFECRILFYLQCGRTLGRRRGTSDISERDLGCISQPPGTDPG